MKSILMILTAVILFGGCCESISKPFSPCLQEKIDAFKLLSGSEQIIKIERPGKPLFWFVDHVADGFEEVVDEDCHFFCVTDCSCITEHGCDPSIFDFSSEVIWEQ